MYDPPFFSLLSPKLGFQSHTVLTNVHLFEVYKKQNRIQMRGFFDPLNKETCHKGLQTICIASRVRQYGGKTPNFHLRAVRVIAMLSAKV